MDREPARYCRSRYSALSIYGRSKVGRSSSARGSVPCHPIIGGVPEWLMGQPRKLMASAAQVRVLSPSDFFFCSPSLSLKLFPHHDLSEDVWRTLDATTILPPQPLDAAVGRLRTRAFQHLARLPQAETSERTLEWPRR